jgi:sortase B
MEKRKKRSITPVHINDPLDEFRVKSRIKEASQIKGGKPGKKSGYLWTVVLCMTLCTAVGTLVFTAVVLTQVLDIVAARKAYALLQALTEQAASNETESTASGDIPVINAFDTKMRKINPEYICWIKIDGTPIDYPVVRGDDNEKYLTLSFDGEKNAYGSLFMDYRCLGDYVPHLIIYGHNTKTGDMFGRLRDFLDEKYLAEHPTITLTVNDRVVEYTIINARKTDIDDPAYFLEFNDSNAFRDFAKRCGVPPGAAQILTLSTCVSAGNDAERVVVQGVYN